VETLSECQIVVQGYLGVTSGLSSKGLTLTSQKADVAHVKASPSLSASLGSLLVVKRNKRGVCKSPLKGEQTRGFRGFKRAREKVVENTVC